MIFLGLPNFVDQDMIEIILLDDQFDRYSPLPGAGIAQHGFQSADHIAALARLTFQIQSYRNRHEASPYVHPGEIRTVNFAEVT